MNKIYFFLLVMLVSITHAQEFNFQKGVVINEVPMVSDSTATYALYLPQKFESSQKWPLLFVFDPEGNGPRAVQAFKEVSDEYGLIVVASNSIRNDVIEKNLAKFDKLSIEVSKKFPIQNTRIFTAGFSGGARLATSIAVITNKIEAVIACGASFSSNTKYYPTKPNFYFIGITGIYDFNNTEMTSVKEYLTNKKIPNELFVFNGRHEWPDAPTLQEAFKWIQLRHLKKYNRLTKEAHLQQYQKEMQVVNDLVTYNREKAIRHLNRVYKNYKLVLEVDSLKKKIRNLKKDKAYKIRARKDWLAVLEEDDLRSMYALYFQDDLKAVNFDNLGWWESQLKQIDSISQSNDFYKSRTGKRLKDLMANASKEIAWTLKDSTQTKKWLYINIFSVLANKTYKPAYFNIIQYGAKKLDYDLALYYTEELFLNGFDDLEKLKKLEGTSVFFLSPDYMELEDIYFKEEEEPESPN